MALRVYLSVVVVLVAVVHANDTHERVVDAPVVEALHQKGEHTGEPRDLGESAAVTAVANNPEEEEENEEDSGATASAEKVVPKPWEKAEAPYEEWAAQAQAVAPAVLKTSIKEPAPPPKVFGMDIKKYRSGRESDELGMKIGMKELRTKNKMKVSNQKYDAISKERTTKQRNIDTAAQVQKDYKHKEGLEKEKIAAAFKEPPAPLPDAAEMANKQSVADKRISDAKDDELAELAKGGDDTELGESAKAPKHVYCKRAANGIKSLCKLSGKSSDGCIAAKQVFSKHCSEARRESPQSVRAIKDAAGKKLSRKLDSVNKATALAVGSLEKQRTDASKPEEKQAISKTILKTKSDAAKKIFSSANRVQKDTAAKLAKLVKAPVLTSKPESDVDIEKKLEAESSKLKIELENLRSQKSAAVTDKTKKNMQHQIEAKEEEITDALSAKSEEITNKAIKKQKASEASETKAEVHLLNEKMKEASPNKKLKLQKEKEEMETLLAEKSHAITKQVQQSAKRALGRAIADMAIRKKKGGDDKAEDTSSNANGKVFLKKGSSLHKAHIAAHQYYHKTGPVPAETHRKATEDVKQWASDAAGVSTGSEHKSDLDAHKAKLVKAAAEAIAPKLSELRHKKSITDNLHKKSKETNPKAAVEAAERQMKVAKSKSGGNTPAHVGDATPDIKDLLKKAHAALAKAKVHKAAPPTPLPDAKKMKAEDNAEIAEETRRFNAMKRKAERLNGVDPGAAVVEKFESDTASGVPATNAVHVSKTAAHGREQVMAAEFFAEKSMGSAESMLDSEADQATAYEAGTENAADDALARIIG